ncbi:MAG: fused MFS/spermidine synthase, partial [Planctomycetota bacterium]
MTRATVYLLFLLSGATALVYEVAWTRRLVLLLGGTTIAVSLILAAWMTGLALGAKLFGRIADRARRPLLLYGVLEAAIAGLALVFPFLLDAANVVAVGIGGRAAGFALCFLVLLIPTTLMGGTLPILARFVVRSLDGLGGRIGLLYGLNTVGAVAGTFLSGFVLIEAVGVFGSTRLAAAVNGLVAFAAILISRRGEAAPAEEPAETAPGPGPAGIALAAAFAAGFLSLASEVLWTRMLTFFLEGFTWAFSAMLTTFLAGLAIGALVSGRLVNRIHRLRGYIGVLFLLSALVSAGVLAAMSGNYEITRWAKTTAFAVSESWRTQYAVSVFLVSFLMLFPPALVMGGIFPAVVRMATGRLGEVGARVGLVYAVNTIGAVAGSLAAGFVLVPVFGMAWGAGVAAF